MTARRLVPAALVVALALGGAACSSSGSSGASSTTKDPAGSAASVSDQAGTDSTVEASDGENPGAETLVDGPADTAHTVTFTTAGAWDPQTLEVAPGQVFTFVSAAGGGTHAVTFNGSDTYTISGGLTESFTLATPGTYTVSEYLSGATMTVVVEG